MSEEQEKKALALVPKLRALLTEDEAKKKICPFSFPSPRDGTLGRSLGPLNCLASMCMAWEWESFIEIRTSAGFSATLNVEDKWAEEISWWWDGRYLKAEGNKYLHRMIAETAFGEIPENMFVDHIDGDPLNMRRDNLRIVTKAEKAANAKSRGGASQYRGVHPSSSASGKWVAQIAKGGVRLHLGTFETEEQAAAAYDAKAKEMHKEFARLNLGPARECKRRGFCGAFGKPAGA